MDNPEFHEHAYYDVTVKYRYWGPRMMAGNIAMEVMGQFYQPYGGTPHAIQDINISIQDPEDCDRG